MILAQVQPIINQVFVPDSGIPWHVYIAALIGAGVAIIGWIVVHQTSQGRDLLNWRRTTLVQSTMELLDASNERFEAVNGRPTVNGRETKGKNSASDLMRTITRQYETIRLIADDDLNSAAKAVWEAHYFSAKATDRMPAGNPGTQAAYDQQQYFISIFKMDEWELDGQHADLTRELKKTISKRKRFRKSNQEEPEHVDPDLKSSSQINRAKANQK